MKRMLSIVLCGLLLFGISGCGAVEADISREEIILVYETAGYQVSSKMYEEKLENGSIAYVQADHPNGDYIYFTFFENNADAKAYEKNMDHPLMKFFFSAISGDACWERLKTYGCVVVTYSDPALFQPFEDLMKEK